MNRHRLFVLCSLAVAALPAAAPAATLKCAADSVKVGSNCVDTYEASVWQIPASQTGLITNQEWQRAAAGTPDSGVDDGSTLCNISATGNPSNTGSRSACVSKWGAFDMVGNVWEWVADWVPRSTA